MVGLSLSEGEKHFIRGGAARDLRADGRGRLLQANGSALVRLGATQVIATVKLPPIDLSEEEFSQFHASSVPVIITLTKVGEHYMVDATSEEESQMCSAVSVSVNKHGEICELTERGGAGLDPGAIADMLSVAKRASQRFISLLDLEMAAAQAQTAG